MPQEQYACTSKKLFYSLLVQYITVALPTRYSVNLFVKPVEFELGLIAGVLCQCHDALLGQLQVLLAAQRRPCHT